MTSLKRENVHTYFYSGNAFLLVGIALVCAFLAITTLLFTPPSFVSDRWLASGLFLLAGLSAVAGLMVPRTARAYNFYRDGLPFLSFPAALLLAGSNSKGVLILLLIAVLANLCFLVANRKYDEIDDEKHVFHIYFRWPF